MRAMDTSTASPARIATPATIVECPWCDSAIELGAAAAEIECIDCRISVEIAPARAVSRRPVLAAA
jgi:hypothetical protein